MSRLRNPAWRPATRSMLLRRAMLAASLPVLLACGVEATVGERPTPQPVLNITPAPTQDVPATQTAFAQRIVPTATPPGLYIVKPGDTLNSIADSFTTTADEIGAYNNIADPNALEVGQELIIPILLTPTESTDQSPSAAP